MLGNLVVQGRTRAEFHIFGVVSSGRGLQIDMSFTYLVVRV
jgi:hypothetical protein